MRTAAAPPVLAPSARADMGVDLGDLRHGRRAPGADRPDRLVGDSELLGREPIRQRARELARDHGERLARVALGQRLADADDGARAPRAAPPRTLAAHQRVALAMIGAALGMAEDDVAAAGIAQHRGADVAGMRALLGRVAILAAERDGGCPRARRRDRHSSVAGGQTQQLAAWRFGLHARGERRSERQPPRA